jgi:hypothetical protein
MFNDNIGFNPFDKNNSVNANGYASKRVKFLSSFNQQHIYVYNGNPRKKISSMNHTTDIGEVISANINNDSDAYFYINGGRKIYAIKQFTCCFCDMDAGRDEQGKYFKPSIVMNKKKQFLKKINEFPVKPSWVVDTRNGYQCYWIFDNASRKMIGSNKTFWSGLQKKLVNYFGGDPRAIKPNQIYRIPYTWWRKGWEKKQPYFTSLLPGSDGATVNVADLKSALTGQPANLQIVPEKCSDEWYKGYAKAYKQSDESGIPVSSNVASEILNDIQEKKKWSNLSKCSTILNDIYDDNDENVEVAHGEPMPVSKGCCNATVDSGDEDINLDGSQTKLLKTVVEFLNQVSTPLYFSNNRFLSSAAKDLANQLSDKFCIG